MHVFLSYPAADRKLAERLREELSRDGVSVWMDDTQIKAGSAWQEQIEDAIRSADDILVLVSPRSSDDAAQQLEWRAALEAVWQDSHKRLIPILVRDAALPPFVFGDAFGGETQAVRIVDPRDVRGASRAIQGALRRGSQQPTPPSYDDEQGGGGGTDSGPKSSYPVEGEERDDRLLELEKLAERLRR